MERVCIIEMCLHRAFVERYKRHVGISCLYCFTCPMVDIYIYKNQAEKQIGGMKANPPAHLPLIHHNHWGHGSWRNHAILFMHTLCFFGRDPIKIFGNPTIQVIKSDSHHSIYERETWKKNGIHIYIKEILFYIPTQVPNLWMVKFKRGFLMPTTWGWLDLGKSFQIFQTESSTHASHTLLPVKAWTPTATSAAMDRSASPAPGSERLNLIFSGMVNWTHGDPRSSIVWF